MLLGQQGTFTNTPKGKIPIYLLLEQLARYCEELTPACFHSLMAYTNLIVDHLPFLRRTLLTLQIRWRALFISWREIYICQSPL